MRRFFTLRGAIDFMVSSCGCVWFSIMISRGPNASFSPSLLKIKALGNAHLSCASFSAAIIGSVLWLMLMTHVPLGSWK